ncbi:MAG: hypothetical protein HYU69_03285 [Bacteroidetes bacterium]|nr:hypothetical protein [Bacteroidota bacterium]
MTDLDGKPIPFVLFRVETSGMNYFITEKGVTYCLYEHVEAQENESKREGKIYDPESEEMEVKWSRIDMELKGASIKKANIDAEGKSEYFEQYFLNHCPSGITDIRSYAKVTIKDVYPGIDWVFYNAGEKGFKYDFIVHPGADPDRIELIYSSLDGLSIDDNGDILIKTRDGELTEHSPVSFQSNKEITSRFIRNDILKNEHSGYDTHVKFSFKEYDPSKTLIIDPQLVWATSYGGTGADGPQSADCDSNGNLYISGYTQQFNGFPTQVHIGNPASYYNNSLGPNGGGIARNIFILKFSNTGVRLWGTYYASTGADWATGYSIKTDLSGNVFVVGTAGSIPTQAHTGNPLAYFNNTNTGGFILKFDNMGNRIWATYYPNCNPQSVTTDASGNVYVTGSAGAAFPTQPFPGNPLAYNQSVFGGGNDAFILKFSNIGDLLWATYFGGSNGETGLSVFTDVGSNIYIGGQTSSTDLPLRAWGGAYNQAANAGNNDGFLARFNSTGTLIWSTYYGGTGVDKIITIRTDTPGNIVAVGLSGSTDLPVQAWGAAYYQPSNAGNDDEFILRFDPSGVRTWATYYGGAGIEDNYSGDNLEIDDCGNIYMGFGAYSLSANIYTFDPGCSNYYQGSHGGGRDCFYVKFNLSGVVQWATYWGGAGSDFATAIALDKQGDMFITGEISGATSGTGYPFTNPGSGAYYDNLPNTNDDAYVAKFTPVIPTYTQSQANPAGCACGSATIQVNCGTPPYNYRWSNGSQLINTSNVTNSIGLCGGNYWVEVTDGACNRDTVYYTLTGPGNGLTLTVTPTDPATCTNSASGTAATTVAGGATPYTYLWNNGQAAQIATGLTAGNYVVTITDNNGCTASQAVNIVLPKGPAGNVVGTNINCNTAGGAIVALNSGTPPFTYTWSNSQTGPVITNLSAGTYSVTVTDNKGCTMTRSVSITGSIPSSATFTQSPGGTICIGTAVTFTNTGTTGTYAWNISPLNPAVSGTTVNFSYTFLTAGTYTVSHSVTTSGCLKTVTSTVTVVNCSNPTVTAAGSSMCPGFCANVTSNAIGGVAPYTYSWSNGATTQNVNTCPVSTTIYTVTIRDATGETATSTAAITVNPAVTVTVVATNISCSGGVGSADAVVGSGSPSYSYNWSNGQSAKIATGLMAGNYTVTVTDSKGCIKTSVTTITNPLPLTGQFTKGTSNCAGCGCKEWLMVSATGGTGPYNYSWPDGYVNRYKNQLCPGTYNVNIVDKNGCSVSINLSTP